MEVIKELFLGVLGGAIGGIIGGYIMVRLVYYFEKKFNK